MPSAVIRAYSYDPPTRTLSVTFTSGRRYRYHEVPAEAFADMRASFAKGEYFNKVIKPRFRCTPED